MVNGTECVWHLERGPESVALRLCSTYNGARVLPLQPFKQAGQVEVVSASCEGFGVVCVPG
jgi:hypothetical protein